MANLGRYLDRNPDMRAAGLSSIMNTNALRESFLVAHIEEEAENRIRPLCRQHRPQPCKRTPKIPTNMIEEIFSNQSKGLFSEFQDNIRENMFIKKPLVGQAREANSKPDYVTNMSRTFGQICDTSPEDSLYCLVLPPKPAEQVNREFADCHDMHIISHNHYFPAEQINRRYAKSFNRYDTFGVHLGIDPSGKSVKGCLKEGDEHLTIVKKPQKDLEDRTKGPLGKKFTWYPYKIPENITFGRTLPHDIDVRSLLENTSPSLYSEKLAGAISHLNMLRKFLQERDDLNINQLITAFGKKDKEGNHQLPLTELIQVMRRMSIPVNMEKVRTAISHFKLFVDEGCCSEKVKYEDWCELLTIVKTLPIVGSISPTPKVMYNKDTAYRQLCADLLKKIPEGPNYRHHHRSLIKQDIYDTRVKDVISPELSTLCGLCPSDFKVLRNKVEIERIFNGIITKKNFESVWQRLMDEHKDQNDMASVAQFRTKMKKID
ncbi:uncharacterized protein LOC108113919 [Drosophila eugracilis]|uniref:uncharacterized protein LOC108113919 n=1 Tax=Drosophila eugracilis TaxID=29029 RepID=UPI0007E70094|nr:uncharacterized protein LOC108113919 [Drosophila eugracilis]